MAATVLLVSIIWIVRRPYFHFSINFCSECVPSFGHQFAALHAIKEEATCRKKLGLRSGFCDVTRTNMSPVGSLQFVLANCGWNMLKHHFLMFEAFSTTLTWHKTISITCQLCSCIVTELAALSKHVGMAGWKDNSMWPHFGSFFFSTFFVQNRFADMLMYVLDVCRYRTIYRRWHIYRPGIVHTVHMFAISLDDIRCNAHTHTHTYIYI